MSDIDRLELDQRKWRLFLAENIDLPEGWSLERIWNLRLQYAREHFKQIKYQEKFPLDKFPRMLVLGAGIGEEVKAAQEFGYRAVGIGLLNKKQLDYAREEQGVDMRIMDMHDMKFPNESFDVVYASYSFEHSVNPWLVCIEVWAVLRVGGRWWLNLPTWNGPKASDTDGPKRGHFMVLPGWFERPMFKYCGFKELYGVDEEFTHQYLLERLPLTECNMLHGIPDFLSKRLQIGKEYI